MLKRILLVDDHVLMLEGLARLLHDAFDIVGTATNGLEAIERAEKLRPEVVVLDVGMPEMNGIETARRISHALPAARIVFVTQRLDPAYLRAAFQAGASAYVAKQSATTELLRAIHLALNGHYYVTPHAGSEAAEYTRLHPGINPSEMFGASLTPRQREILQLVAEGRTGKEISALLRISPKTVEYHRNSIMDHLGMRTTADLIRYAVSRGIVTP